MSSALTEEPPIQVGTGKMFQPGYNADLDEVTDEHSLKARIGSRSIRKTSDAKQGIEKLKVAYNNVFGYYIEVSKVHSDKVPDQYERKQTLTQQ